MNEGRSAAIYLRTAPMGPVEAGVSLNDQKISVMLAATDLGCFVEAEYIDIGWSQQCDQRADFQRLIADCCSDRRPYKTVIVHASSPISRGHIEVEACRRMIDEVGLELISATCLVDGQEYWR